MKFIATLFASALLASGACAANPVVVIKTSKGDITVELDKEKAPGSVANFLKYVEKKHYDGTIFHRVIGNFMIQGGGFAKGETPKQKEVMAPIQNEAKNGLSNVRGTLAMARTGDPHSATAQFFINVVDNSKGLDPGGFSPDGYAVFGKVTGGMETVDKINSVKTGRGTLEAKGGKRPFQDVPVEPIVIESISLQAAAAPAPAADKAAATTEEATETPSE